MPSKNIIRKQTARKDAIVAAAMHLIRERGLESASLSNIAHAAGISKGTLHYYFSSKTELIFDISQKHVDDISTRMFRLIDDRTGNADPIEILTSLLDYHRKSGIRIQLHLDLLQKAQKGDSLLQSRLKEKYIEWKASVVEGLSRMLPDRADIDLLSHLIVAVIDGINIQTMLGMEDIPLRRIADHLIQRDQQNMDSKSSGASCRYSNGDRKQ